MVASNYPDSITRVLKWEGGYSNHPSDPGGETNYGITVAVARANGYTGPMRSLPLEKAKDIYRIKYARPLAFDMHRAGIDYALLDYGVNSGVGRANKVIRRVCNLPDKASFSDVLQAIEKRDPKAIVAAIDAERLKFLQSLKTWPTFGKGWGSRVSGVNAVALAMAAASAALPTLPEVPKPPDAVQAKGEVSKPNTTAPIAAAGGSGATAGGFGFGDWVAAHPVWSVLIFVVGVAIIIVLAEYAAHRWKVTKQDAPTPGIVPVPELQH